MSERDRRLTPQPLGPKTGTLGKADATSDQLTAASIGNLDWLQLCMEAAGSQIEQDRNGFTALHMAALHGQLRCLKLLIEHYKMDVNLPSRSGWRALHLVLSQKNRKRAKQCLQFLLSCGADVNVESENMVTPLHQAAREGLEDCLAILVENGADVHAKDQQGNCPIDLCKIWCHRNCARHLHNAMWKKDKEEFAHEVKKMEKLKRNILEMDQEALLTTMKTHRIPHKACFCDGTETKKPPEKARGTSVKTKVSSSSKPGQMSCKRSPGTEQHKKKLSASEGLDKDTKEKRTHTMSSYREEGTKRLEDGTPTLRLGIDPEDVTKSDFSDIVTLDKDEHGQPQIKTIQGQILPSLPNLPYETIQRCLFPKTGPKERICMPYEFKANHVFDVPKKQQPLEGRKPASEISFHLRQNLDSRLRTANKSTKR